MVFEKRASAILKETYIRSTYITDQTKFIEHCQYGKQIGKILDIKNTQKCPQAQKPTFLGLESDKSENILCFLKVWKIYEICSRNFCAEWIIRFSKRAHEVPNLSKGDLGEKSETL